MDRAFLEKAPKADLHLHLDGSLRIGTLLDLSKEAGVKLPSWSEEGLKELVFKEKYRDLPDYLQGFGYTCAALQTPESLERTAYELALDNAAEGVRYIEVRYAPQQHIHEGFAMDEVVKAVAAGLERGAKEINARPEVREGKAMKFRYGILLCAMRAIFPGMGRYYEWLRGGMARAGMDEFVGTAAVEVARAAVALRDEGMPVVGLDLAGAENGFPAKWAKKAYKIADRGMLGKTVHAGEAYGAESIWQALTACRADRIGHGTWLLDAGKVQDEGIADKEAFVRRLADEIGTRGITLEVCPTSNLQTLPELADLGMHPLKKMLAEGLPVTICTDNRLVSRTSVTEEMWRVKEALQPSDAQMKAMALQGFRGAFAGPGGFAEKRAMVAEAEARWGEVGG